MINGAATYEDLKKIVPDLAEKIEEKYRTGYVFVLSDKNNNLFIINKEEWIKKTNKVGELVITHGKDCCAIKGIPRITKVIK